jgi:hypothetical protein
MQTSNPVPNPEDFGFTFVHEDEIQEEQDKAAKAAAEAAAFNATFKTAESYKEKLDAVQAIIVPFMQNLMKDPDKVMIRWPNRKEVVEKQLKKILSITKE